MRRVWQGLTTLGLSFGLVLALGPASALGETLDNSDSSETLEGATLFSQLVTVAIEYDTYNQRCRGVSASQNSSNVNRLFLRKYGVTLNNYVKSYIQTDVRAFKSELKNRVYTKVVTSGGCRQADENGYEQSLKTDFRKLYRAVEQSPWYPEVTNR